MKENILLKIESEFVNGSIIVESICNGVILDLSNEVPIKRILTEDETSRVES